MLKEMLCGPLITISITLKLLSSGIKCLKRAAHHNNRKRYVKLYN